MPYIGLPIKTDSKRLSADILDRLMTNIPGWIPREGNIEVWVVEAIAFAMAEVLGVASRIDRSIFRYFGQSLIGLAPIDGAPATMPTTWTMTDALGHTIPAGTTAALRTTAGVLVPFVTLVDVIVPAGQVATPAGSVTMYSTDVGADKNGYPASALELVDALAFVDTVVSTAATAGGTDAETDDDYLNRLVAELQLLTPRPILAADFAVYARKVTGVARAAALDNYNPADDTFGNEKMVTVSMVDTAGADVSAAVKADAAAQFAAVREINFVVNIIDPTRTVINVNYAAVALPGYSIEDLRTAINTAVTAYVDPAKWGSTPSDPAAWTQHGTVRYLSIAGIIEAVPGVDYLTALTVNGGGVDIALGGRISLPTVGVIDGTVS